MSTASLLVSCPDQRGIVAAVSSFVTAHGGNIVDLQQHTDTAADAFFQRVEFDLAGLDLGRDEIGPAFAEVARQYAMDWTLQFAGYRPRVAILASKEPHCLVDLLGRVRAGELDANVTSVVSNHPDHAELAGWYGVPYHHLPVTGDTPADRDAQERRVDEVLRSDEVDLVILARYMRILSPAFCETWSGKVINIHHSFLPSFVGARPYHQAHERGVKLIGVTAHYVTADLDQGPIIEQDTIRVSHRDDVEELRRKGRDLEVAVLARAVRAHIQHRILIYGHRTVVFD